MLQNPLAITVNEFLAEFDQTQYRTVASPTPPAKATTNSRVDMQLLHPEDLETKSPR